MAEAIGILADTSAFKKLAHNFAEAAPQAKRAAQKVLRAVALEVAADAKERSGFSQRISGSVKVRMAGLNAKVSAGGGSAYFAVPVENRGKGNVTHPTFGHDPITNKGSHPAFLMPAFEEHVEEYVVALKEAVEEATAVALADDL